MAKIALPTTIGTLDTIITGSGPDVVFLHGLMTNSAVWDEVTTQIGAAARCIRVDMPLGAHHKPVLANADLSIPALAASLAPALAKLCPEGYYLVGSDTGGVVAQQLACHHSQGIQGVLLLPCDIYDNFLPLPLRYIQYLAHIPGSIWAIRWALEVPLLRNTPIAFGWLTQKELSRSLVRGSIDPLRSKGIRRDLAKVLRAINPAITLATAKNLPGVHIPIHFLWATEDKLFPVAKARQLAADIGKTARWNEVEGSYSFIQLDRPHEVVSAVHKLLGED